MREHPVIQMVVRCSDRTYIIEGREAFAMDALCSRGETGVTPLDWVGPRWSDYVRKLRLRGIEIETVSEQHGGAYAGRHGRYVLRSKVEVLKVVREGEGRRDAA